MIRSTLPPGSARTATATTMARLAISALAKKVANNRAENRMDMRTALAARDALYAFNCRAIQSADLPRYA
jgi:hypothetical protein